jgi:hypothetical protein
MVSEFIYALDDFIAGRDVCITSDRVLDLWEQVEPLVKSDLENYLNVVERNRINGRKGGRPKKNNSETQKTQVVILETQKTQVVNLETQNNHKEKDKDKDNDNEKDNDIDNEKKKSIKKEISLHKIFTPINEGTKSASFLYEKLTDEERRLADKQIEELYNQKYSTK